MEPNKSMLAPVILSAVISAVVFGGLGYYLATNPSTPSLAPTTPSQTVATTSPAVITTTESPIPTITATADPTASWKTYTNTTYGFNFKYPPSFSVTASARTFLDALGANCQTVTLTSKSSLMACDKTANLTQYGLNAPDGMDASTSSDLTIGGQAAKKYISNSGTSYVVVSPNGNRITLDTSDNTTQNITTLEQLLSTLQFSK